MPSNEKPGQPGQRGKPDLSVLDRKKALSIIEKGHDEGSGLPEEPPAPSEPPSLPSGQPSAYVPPARVAKVPVSLRLPQPMTDKVMELAAEETLRTKVRVTPHDIYVRAIGAYLDSLPKTAG